MLDDSRLPENIKSKSRGVLKSHIFDKISFYDILSCVEGDIFGECSLYDGRLCGETE